MRNLQIGLTASVIAGLIVAQLASAQQAPRQGQTPQSPPRTSTTSTTPTMTGMTSDQVIKEIQTMHGFVPQFFRSIPEALLPAFWANMKFEMNPTSALDVRTKELIGVAVAAQIPCDYCVQFHTEAARMNGATDQQIREAVGMASVTRQGSTLLNGLQIDRAQFRKDVQRLMKEGKRNGSPTPQTSRR